MRIFPVDAQLLPFVGIRVSHITMFVITKPCNYKQALNNSKWQDAMTKEYNALMQNNPWTLMPHKRDMNLFNR